MTNIQIIVQRKLEEKIKQAAELQYKRNRTYEEDMELVQLRDEIELIERDLEEVF